MKLKHFDLFYYENIIYNSFAHIWYLCLYSIYFTVSLVLHTALYFYLLKVN